MQTFDNTKNIAVETKGYDAVIKICFTLSTASGAFSGFAGVRSLLTENGILAEQTLTYYAANCAIYAGLFYVFSKVDFFGIMRVGYAAITETIGFVMSRNGSFTPYGFLRSTAMVLRLLIAGLFFAISFFTSWNGSELTKNYLAPKIKTDKLATVDGERGKEIKSVESRYTTRRDAIAADRERELAAVKNSELSKAARKGDAWAAGEVAKKESAIRSKFQKKTDAVDAEEKAERTAAGARFDKRTAIAAAQDDAELQKTKQEGDAIGWILLAFGVTPVVIGTIMVGVKAINFVADEVAKTGRKVASQSGGTHAYGNAGSVAAYGSKKRGAPTARRNF
jgi:hypothetical protein